MRLLFLDARRHMRLDPSGFVFATREREDDGAARKPKAKFIPTCPVRPGVPHTWSSPPSHARRTPRFFPASGIGAVLVRSVSVTRHTITCMRFAINHTYYLI